MGRILGIPNVAGYLTSGGTEGNLAAIWFCKNNLVGRSQKLIRSLKQEVKELKRKDDPNYELLLKKKKELNKLVRPYLVCTKNSHFSVTKVAGVIELNQLFIDNTPEGTMDLLNLRAKLTKLQKYQNINFVVNVNFGTTTLAGFDDVFEIRRIFDELKNEGWNYTVNMDMAMYGPTLPILRQLGDQSDSLTSCGIDTCAISLWKFIGVNIPCGVALCTREFIDASFGHVDVYDSYQEKTLDKFILNQSRSGVAAA